MASLKLRLVQAVICHVISVALLSLGLSRLCRVILGRAKGPYGVIVDGRGVIRLPV